LVVLLTLSIGKMAPSSTLSLDVEEELLFEAEGEILVNGESKHKGKIQVIQGPKYETGAAEGETADLAADTEFYCFLCFGRVNVPLVPQNHIEKISSHEYDIKTPDSELKVIFKDDRKDGTEEELLNEFEDVLVWFCKYRKPVEEAGSNGKLEAIGNQGVSVVQSIGNRIHYRIARALQPHLERARSEETEEIGDTASKIVKTTRQVVGEGAKVVGAGAQAVDQVTNSTSRSVANVVSSINSSDLPLTSRRFRLRQTLNSGLTAAEKVYDAAGQKGKDIKTHTKNSASETIYEKYGDEVDKAAMETGDVAYNTIKILRFPATLAVRGLIGGVIKSSTIVEAEKAAKEAEGTKEQMHIFEELQN